MNAHAHIIAAALPFAISLSASFPALAADASGPARLVIDCSQPVQPPSLSAIAEVSGEHNLALLKREREQVMARVHRACQAPGVRQLWVVRDQPDAVTRTSLQQIASNTRPIR